MAENYKKREWSTWHGENLPLFNPNAFIQQMKKAGGSACQRDLLLTDKETGKRYVLKVSVEETHEQQPQDLGQALLGMHPNCWY